jgi:hypothetical protein
MKSPKIVLMSKNAPKEMLQITSKIKENLPSRIFVFLMLTAIAYIGHNVLRSENLVAETNSFLSSESV